MVGGPAQKGSPKVLQGGKDWLDIMTGRARTDEEEVGGVQEDEDGEGR